MTSHNNWKRVQDRQRMHVEILHSCRSKPRVEKPPKVKPQKYRGGVMFAGGNHRCYHPISLPKITILETHE